MGGKPQIRSVVTRRKFLGTAGLALGASTLAPAISVFDPVLRWGSRKFFAHEIKIGVLLPESNIYPAMTDNFYSGLKLYFATSDNGSLQQNVKLLPAQISFGPSSLILKSRHLIEDEGVDILTGIMSESVSWELRNLLEKNNRLLVANHTGANQLYPHDHSTSVIHNSLHLWQANYRLGAWAAGNIGKKALVLSSFYESGYDALYAFNAGFESQGGTILDTRITNLPAEMGNTNSLIPEIAGYPADLVFASFSGSEARAFLNDYMRSGLSHRLPLVGSGFLVENDGRSGQMDFPFGIKTCLSWAPGLDNSIHQEFQKQFRMMTGREADAFAALGYESGALISGAVAASNGNLRNRDIVHNVLAEQKISGPRGNLILNKNTRVYESPLYLRELCAGTDRIDNMIISEFDTKVTHEAVSDNLKSGWLNPYLCA